MNTVKKGYLLEDEENGHYSYKAEVDDYGYTNIVKLFYSRIGNWTNKVRGKMLVKAVADKDFNTTFTFDDSTIITLNICQVDAIAKIAKLMNECGEKNIFNNHKIVKKD